MCSVPYEPEKIEQGIPEPADFDSFWDRAQADVLEIPLDAKMEKEPLKSTDEWTMYRVSFASIGRRVYGWLSIPTGGRGPWPAEVTVPGAGCSVSMDGVPKKVKMLLTVLPFEPSLDGRRNQSNYDALNAGLKERYGVPRYPFAGMDVSPREYFYYPVILGAVRAVRWLVERPEVDRHRVHYVGGSQGGGFGLYLSALCGELFEYVVADVPALTDTLGWAKGRNGGWPHADLEWSVADKKGRDAAMIRVMPYFDGCNFAARSKCYVRIVAGLSDWVCPPAAVCAAYNRMTRRGKKLILAYHGTHLDAGSKAHEQECREANARAAESAVREFHAQAARRIAEIRQTRNLEIPVGVPTRWLSANAGDDKADGMSPSRAWRSLERLNDAVLPAGCYVLFERGNTFRGFVKAQAGVTYASYGRGAKPRIVCSPENGANPRKWRLTDTPNVWAYLVGHRDVGTLVFDEGAVWATKAILRTDRKTGKKFEYETGRPFSSYRDLKGDLRFWHDYYEKGTGEVYLYSEKNPGERFSSIEFNVRRSGIGVFGDGVTIDGLSIAHAGVHGVAAGTRRNLTVRNCEFAWIGGAIQAEGLFGRDYPTRLGNAVEIYGGCENYVVSNCYFHQIYDAGVTHQYNIPETEGLRRFDHRHVRYLDNVFENCNYSVEYFLTAPGRNQSLMEDVLIARNLMFDAGCGFCEQRPDRNEAAHIKGRYDPERNRARNFVIRDNVLCRSRDMLIEACAGLLADGKSSLPLLEGNVFVGREGDCLGRIAMERIPRRAYDASAQSFFNALGKGNRCIFLPTRGHSSSLSTQTHQQRRYP